MGTPEKGVIPRSGGAGTDVKMCAGLREYDVVPHRSIHIIRPIELAYDLSHNREDNMKLGSILFAVAIVIGGAVSARADWAQYDLELTSANCRSGASTISFPISVDSSQKLTAFTVIADSVEFIWTETRFMPDVTVRNLASQSIVLIWDSTTAIDTRGFLIDLIPTGITLNDDLTAPPKKLKPRQKFSGAFVQTTRESRYEVRYNPILPYNSDDNRQGKFVDVARSTVGKSFSYTIAVSRDNTITRYNFYFAVKGVTIK